MSGGSWDYFCFKMDDVVCRLCEEKDPLRRAFGEHMRLCAKAMRDIEWADSGDKQSGSEVEAIRDVFGDNANSKVLEVLIQDGERVIEQLKAHGVASDV